MRGVCKRCGTGEFLPFKCRFCGDAFCAEHRIPETHECPGLADWRTRVREDRPSLPSRREREMAPAGRHVPTHRRALGRARAFVTRSATSTLLVLIVVGFLLQWVGGALWGLATGAPGVCPTDGRVVSASGSALCGVDQVVRVFGAGPGAGSLLEKPWAPLTSLFLHGSPPSTIGALYHLFFNALVLFFFGPWVESRIGDRRTILFFLGAGVGGAIAEAALGGGIVVGASAGVLAFLACIAVLAPYRQIHLFGILPMPMWVLAGLVLLATFLLSLAGGGVAVIAHVVGLAAGAAYGWQLRTRGIFLRERDRSPWQRY